MLHETVSVPDGNPPGNYEVIAQLLIDGCNQLTEITSGPVTVWAGAFPAKAPAPVPNSGSSTRKASPRSTATGTPASGPSADPAPSSPSDSPSPSPSASPTSSPTPTPSASPTAVDSPSAPVQPSAAPLVASPAVHSDSALPWVLGAVAAVATGAVFGWRRRRPARAAAEPAGPTPAGETVVLPVAAAQDPTEAVPAAEEGTPDRPGPAVD
ncbi:hypothetical protein ACFW1A_33855 [Kitasatospora sp. NPDC058965]|uniref:hypothetical protein n=1 Tax=Kitasatospora sp. NPDC058965 TaxID=3346682 RepID=UPI0036C7E2A4